MANSQSIHIELSRGSLHRLVRSFGCVDGLLNERLYHLDLFCVFLSPIGRGIAAPKERAEQRAVCGSSAWQKVNSVAGPTPMYRDCITAEVNDPAVIHITWPQTGAKRVCLSRCETPPIRDLRTRAKGFNAGKPMSAVWHDVGRDLTRHKISDHWRGSGRLLVECRSH